MNPPLSFGDTFLVKEIEYIFLGIDGEILYAAKILDLELSKQVEKFLMNRIAGNKATNKTIFCFVKLITPQYKNRIASLTKPELNKNIKIKKLKVVIEDEDKEKLKEEILTSDLAPIGLQQNFSS